jgi:prepilin-type processing-associated H-X9-DG protein
MSVSRQRNGAGHMDTSVILFTMWTESIKHFSENSSGNVIFLDGSVEGMDRTLKQTMGLNLVTDDKVKK